MPYFVIPKGQSAAETWISLPPVLSEAYRARTRTYEYLADSTVDCDACARKTTDCDGAPKYYSYTNTLCARCLDYLCTQDVYAPQPSQTAFLTRQEAHAASDPKTEDVIFRASPHDVGEWCCKEDNLRANGEILNVPWRVNDACRYHYARIAFTHEGKIAFYRDIESGVTGRLSYMRAGRYLQTFYADTYSERQRADYVAQVAALTQASYALATSADDIAAIYNTAKGPDSCMRRKSHAEYDWQHLLDDDRMPCHPCAIYGDADLALAYTGPKHAISQRAIVWPEKKRYIRIYGTGPLELLLKRDGYTRADFEGARLRCVQFTDPELNQRAIVTPYVDRLSGSHSFAAATARISDDQQWLVLDPYGDIDLGVTQGHNNNRITVEERPEQVACDHCGEWVNEDDLRSGLCQECYDDRYTSCYYCSESITRGEEFAAPNGHPYCPSCVDTFTSTCAYDTCDNTFLEMGRDNFDRTQRRAHAVTGYCDMHAREIIAAHAAPPNSDPRSNNPDQRYEVRRIYPTGHSGPAYPDSHRMRPNGEYVVMNVNSTLNGTYEECAALMSRMQCNFPTACYRIAVVPSVPSPVVESPEAPIHETV